MDLFLEALNTISFNSAEEHDHEHGHGNEGSCCGGGCGCSH